MRTLLIAIVALVLASLAMAQNGGDAFVVKIPGASMTSSVTFSASNSSVSPGQTVEIPIVMACKSAASPATFQIDLDFDQQKLTFVAARAGPQLTVANKSVSASVLANGDVRLLTSGTDPAAFTDGTVAYASFMLKPQFFTGSTTLSLFHCVANSVTGSALATAGAAGTVKTMGCDLDGDGSVTVTDVQLIVNEALGGATPSHDLNQDGIVNVIDVQKTINAALRLGCL